MWSFSPSTVFLLVVALLAGAVVPFQAGANASLGRALGHPLWATVGSLIVSIAVVFPVMIAMRAPSPLVGAAFKIPAWSWFGGVAGVVYITAALLLTPRLGAANFIVCVVAGQMVSSLLIDHFGLMGLPEKPVNLGRLLGLALILGGMVLVQLSTAPAPVLVPQANSR